MGRTRQVIVDMGAASLGSTEALAFRILPSAGNPAFAFGCEDHQRFSHSGSPQPQFIWFLGTAPPVPGEPSFPLDRPAGTPDRYGVQLFFAQCPSYRLQILKLPTKALVLDILYSSDIPNDQFIEPFTVTAL